MSKTISNNYVIVKCNSHRARRKMYQAIGKQQEYFSWDRNGEFYKLSPSQAEIVLKITGISKSRDRNDLHKCISFR